jgi:flagellar hook-basal body complex protein FliE
MPAPIDPSFLTIGPEWQVTPLAPAEGTVSAAEPAGGTKSFGDELIGAMESLQRTQSEAATASRDLATGQVDDPTQVIMAIERARLSMELAAQVRNKAVEAYQEIFRTQV